MEPALIFGLVIVAIVVIAVAQWRMKLARQRAMAAAAAKLGMQFAVDDPFGLDELPFRLFQRGDGRGCENVLWGTWQKMDLRLADYWYYDESTDAEGRSSRHYHRFSVAVAALGLRCPPLEIGPEGFFSRIADHIGFRDIEFESEEFNRAFNIRCDDRKFATDLIDARMMQWLLYAGPAYSFETSGALVLCLTHRLDPSEYANLAGCLKAFCEHVPRVVHELYAGSA